MRLEETLRAVFDEAAFSRGARRALSWFDVVVAANDPITPETALWGALLIDARTYTSTLAAVVTSHLEARRRDATPRALGIAITPSEPNFTLDPARLGALSDVLSLASTLRDRTLPEETIHRRHLVVALLLLHPDPIVDAGADEAALRDDLLSVLRDTAPLDNHAAWEAAFEEPPPAAPTPADRARQRAGYHADAVGAAGALTDELRVGAEVNVLCDVLAAQDAVPPISVGLFGRWGTGKSYFMSLMLQRMARLAAVAAKNPKQTAYCPNIVQITFNAWHYMDANLWATLAVRIFEGLSEADRENEAADESGRLLDELNRREKHLATIDQKIGRALDDPRFKNAAEGVGLESARMDLLALTGEVTRFRGLLTAAWAALTRPDLWSARRRRALRWALVTAVLLALVVGPISVAAGGLSEVPGALATLAAPLVAAAAVALRQVKLLHTGLRAANEALGRVGLRSMDVTASRAEQDPEIQRIKRRLAELDRRRGLFDFVLERAGSDDYRRHFGLISVLRSDLERLANHLGSTDSPPRIVLYIDDLDRCPPVQVVEVLQAVHLLLAFPLFVVVVGVDPRWLLRSLEQHFTEILSSGADGDGRAPRYDAGKEQFWESTPQNYLEKIFQIPFALRPMATDGFGRLVDTLLTPTPDAAATAGGDAGAGQGGAGTGTKAPGAGGQAPDGGGPTDSAIATQAEGAPGATVDSAVPAAGAHRQPSPAATTPPDDIDPNPAALAVSEDEVAFARSLGGLVATPREAKRLVNVYRLLRASVLTEPGKDFVATRLYEPLLVLLAVLVGYPREAQSLFRVLREGGRKGDDTGATASWHSLVQSLEPRRATPDAPLSNRIGARLTDAEAERWRTVVAALQGLPPGLSDDLAQFREGVGLVERYSFDTALAYVASAAASPSAEPPFSQPAPPPTAGHG